MKPRCVCAPLTPPAERRVRRVAQELALAHSALRRHLPQAARAAPHALVLHDVQARLEQGMFGTKPHPHETPYRYVASTSEFLLHHTEDREPMNSIPREIARNIASHGELTSSSHGSFRAAGSEVVQPMSGIGLEPRMSVRLTRPHRGMEPPHETQSATASSSPPRRSPAPRRVVAGLSVAPPHPSVPLPARLSIFLLHKEKHA